jgi:hypothetical protein
MSNRVIDFSNAISRRYVGRGQHGCAGPLSFSCSPPGHDAAEIDLLRREETNEEDREQR